MTFGTMFNYYSYVEMRHTVRARTTYDLSFRWKHENIGKFDGREVGYFFENNFEILAFSHD